MTTLEDLLTILPYDILPQLKLSDIRALLLTSKSLYTALSPSMETIYYAKFPNEPLLLNSTRNESYWTRRFLTRTGASQVYGWGQNKNNRLCLSPPFPTEPDGANMDVVPITHSEMLSRLGIKKFAIHHDSLVALSLKNRVYIMKDNESDSLPHPMPPARLFEFEGLNEFIVDVAATNYVIFALSDSGKLYMWERGTIPLATPNFKFVEFDLERELGLPNKPRIISVTAGKFSAAFRVEDVGVLGWNERDFPHRAVLPRVSNSLEADWDVVDVGVTDLLFVLVLANGRIYTVINYLRDGKFPPPELYEFSEPVERVWCGFIKIFAGTRKEELFELTHPEALSLDYPSIPSKVEDVDASRISTIAIGIDHNVALLDDGTLYIWGDGYCDLPNLKSEKSECYWSDTPEKMNLENVVSVVARHDFSVAIVIDTNEPAKTKAARKSGQRY